MSESFRLISRESRRFLPDELVDGPAWDRLVHRVGQLPTWPVLDRVFFEFHLAEPAPLADVSVRVLPGHPRLTDYYVRRGMAAQPDSRAARLGSFLGRMATTGMLSPASTHKWFNNIMLEYDITDVALEESPDPGLFLGLRPALSPEEPTVPSPGDVVAELANAVGWNDDVAERSVVERVVEALPARGQLDHVGAMPGRSKRAIRVIVCGISQKDLPDLLERVNWPGRVRNVMDVLADWSDVLPYFRPCFDVSSEGPGPRLGLEMFPKSERKGRWPVGDWLTTGRNTWLPVVKRLEDRKMCTARKGRGLRAFPGVDRILDEAGVFVLHKGLNHVKFTIQGDGVQSKAYAGLRLLQINPEATAAR